MESCIRVKMLGQCVLEWKGKSVSIAPEKRWILLLYLLCNRGKLVQKDEIISALWGDKELANADNSIRGVVFNLRDAFDILEKGLGTKVVQQQFGAYRLSEEFRIRTDLDELEDCYREWKVKRVVDKADFLRLEKVIALYKGDVFIGPRESVWQYVWQGYCRRLYQSLLAYREDLQEQGLLFVKERCVL